MATLTIRNLDDEIKSRLRIRAARNDRSMEEEVRLILRHALLDTDDAGATPGLGTRIRQRLEATGGVDLELPEHSEAARIPQDLE